MHHVHVRSTEERPEINEHAPYNGLFHGAFYVVFI